MAGTISQNNERTGVSKNPREYKQTDGKSYIILFISIYTLKMYMHSEHEGGMYKSIYSRGVGISETNLRPIHLTTFLKLLGNFKKLLKKGFGENA